jgi:hypothetical protein
MKMELRFGQQVKWLDASKQWHQGTAVSNQGNGVWGVSHNMNPQQGCKPDCFVKQMGNTLVVINAAQPARERGLGNMVYAENYARQTDRKLPARQVGIGNMMYKDMYKKQLSGGM